MRSIAASLLLMAAPLLPVAAAANGTGCVTVPPGILQESAQRVERTFGRAVQVRPGPGTMERQLLFDPAPWRQLWPALPDDAEFGITLGPQGEVRAVWLDVNAMVREARTGVSQEFSFGRKEAAAFFLGIFGRDPMQWQELPLPGGGGGHEGFLDHRVCVDPGVALTFITYRLGQEWIRLVGDLRCT